MLKDKAKLLASGGRGWRHVRCFNCHWPSPGRSRPVVATAGAWPVAVHCPRLFASPGHPSHSKRLLVYFEIVLIEGTKDDALALSVLGQFLFYRLQGHGTGFLGRVTIRPGADAGKGHTAQA